MSQNAFTPCSHPDLPGRVAEIATEALPAWQAKGWEPIGDSRTIPEAQAQAAADEAAAEALVEEVPDLTVAQVLDEVGDDPDKAAAALEAELARDNPRKTLVDRLTPKAGQPGDPEGN